MKENKSYIQFFLDRYYPACKDFVDLQKNDRYKYSVYSRFHGVKKFRFSGHYIRRVCLPYGARFNEKENTIRFFGRKYSPMGAFCAIDVDQIISYIGRENNELKSQPLLPEIHVPVDPERYAELEKCMLRNGGSDRRIWFYNDGCIPEVRERPPIRAKKNIKNNDRYEEIMATVDKYTGFSKFF